MNPGFSMVELKSAGAIVVTKPGLVMVLTKSSRDKCPMEGEADGEADTD